MKKLDIDATKVQYENAPMMLGMYTIFDKKSSQYDTPFFCQKDLFAKRHFEMLICKDGTMLNNFKDDFELHLIGYMDTQMGDFIVSREFIIAGKDIIVKEKN